MAILQDNKVLMSDGKRHLYKTLNEKLDTDTIDDLGQNSVSMDDTQRDSVVRIGEARKGQDVKGGMEG